MSAVLVAGVGNIFDGDDAFGVEVAQRLLRLPPIDGVRVVDFGIRAIDLAYALQGDCDAAVLVDATSRGGAPGTLYVVEPDLHDATAIAGAAGERSGADISLGHGFDPNALLRLLAGTPGRCKRLVIVGCEPQTLGDQFDGALGLSDTVAASVERALPVVQRVARRLAADEVALSP